MHIQLCKVSIPETVRSLHTITSKLKKIMKNAVFCHFIDFLANLGVSLRHKHINL